jgi:dienelactone hydrolase
MSQHIVLFHAALGVRPAVLAFAEELRAAGHTVTTPDLFDGEVFETLEAGIAKRDAVGIPELMRRAQAAVASLPNDLIYAGFSMGAAAAEFLAGTRPGARAAILMHAAIPLEQARVSAWPPGVPVQLHFAKDDPFVDLKAVEALAAAVRRAGTSIDIYTYQRGGHLFADSAFADYNAASAWLMLERVLEFVARLELAQSPRADVTTSAGSTSPAPSP